jgi:hypothetical protein
VTRVGHDDGTGEGPRAGTCRHGAERGARSRLETGRFARQALAPALLWCRPMAYGASLRVPAFAALASALVGCTTIISFPDFVAGTADAGVDGTDAGGGGAGTGHGGAANAGGGAGAGGTAGGPDAGSGAGGGGAGTGGAAGHGGAATGGSGGGTGGSGGTGGAGGGEDGGVGGGAPDASAPDAASDAGPDAGDPPTGACLWSHLWGDAQNQAGLRVARTSQGHLAMLGNFGGTIDFGAGPLTTASFDVFVAEVDASGAALWSRSFPVTNTETRGLAVGPGDTLFVGGTVGKNGTSGTIAFGPQQTGTGVYVAKLDASGLASWARIVGAGAGSAATLTRIATTPLGDVVVLGSFDAPVDFGDGVRTPAGKTDLFVLQLHGASGDLAWVRTFGDASYQTPEALAIDSKGAIVIAGEFGGTLDFGGGVPPIASQGGPDDAAPANAPTSPGADVFVAKLDATGKAIWARRFGDADIQTAQGITIGVDDHVIVAGEMRGAIDARPGIWQQGNGSVSTFGASLDATGVTQWARVWPGGQLMNDLFLTTRGHVVYLAGRFTGNLSFDQALHSASNAPNSDDVFIAAIDDAAYGAVPWARAYGDAAFQAPGGLVADGAEVVVYGWSQGTLDLGCGPATSAGINDVFAAAIAP